MILFKKKIFYSHAENKMLNEGDIIGARKYFFNEKNLNLFYLLKNRYEWINKYLAPTDNCLELGAGASFLKIFLKNNIKVSDLQDYDFLDYKNIDAIDTKFPSSSFDKVISSNLIHHIAYPIKHFREVSRILKIGGFYIIQDINCSLATQLAIILAKHEGFDFTVDPKNENISCNNPLDPWSGNVALPNLIFDNFKSFNEKIDNNFEIVYKSYSEFLIFINSGGVIAKTKFIPLNNFFNRMVLKVDKFLAKFPKIFAMQKSIVLKKIK